MRSSRFRYRELESLTAEHPYREPLWLQLITAYYLAGRQSDALDAYRRLRTLIDDLGIDPGLPIRALHGRILRQEPLDVSKQPSAPPLSRSATSAGTPRSSRDLRWRGCATQRDGATR